MNRQYTFHRQSQLKRSTLQEKLPLKESTAQPSRMQGQNTWADVRVEEIKKKYDSPSQKETDLEAATRLENRRLSHQRVRTDLPNSAQPLREITTNQRNPRFSYEANGIVVSRWNAG